MIEKGNGRFLKSPNYRAFIKYVFLFSLDKLNFNEGGMDL